MCMYVRMRSPAKRHFRVLHGWLLKLNSHRRFSSYSFLRWIMAVEKDSEYFILTAVICYFCYFQTWGKKGFVENNSRYHTNWGNEITYVTGTWILFGGSLSIIVFLRLPFRLSCQASWWIVYLKLPLVGQGWYSSWGNNKNDWLINKRKSLRRYSR